MVLRAGRSIYPSWGNKVREIISVETVYCTIELLYAGRNYKNTPSTWHKQNLQDIP